jgi:polyhydroxyalkanoate synthesis repressor PhaR
MARLVKRYGGGSRKLYDTEESRYVSLGELAGWVRGGQDVRVVESAGGEDVTRQVLAQVILEGEKRGIAFLSADLLHAVIRRGEAAVAARVEQLQHGVDRIVRNSIEHIGPVREARSEVDALRDGIASLERSLAELERTTVSRKRAPRGVRQVKGKRSAHRRRR